MENVTRTGRRLIKDGHVVDFYEDTIEFEDGHTAKWDFLHHHSNAAAVIAVNAEGKLLMVRQYRNAIDRETLEIPAGKKDTPEEPGIECAARELEEETGYKAGKLTYLFKLVTAIAYCDETIEVFLAEDLQASKQNLDEDEYIDVEEYTLRELIDMVFLKKIQDSKTVAAINAYASWLFMNREQQA